MTTVLRGIGRLFRGEGEVLERAAVVIEGEVLSFVGEERELPRLGEAAELDLGGALVTPGLIDSHSHPLYGGDRFAEIALRSSGAGYGEIAAAGGGIAASVAATRSSSLEELADRLAERLASWLAGGTTTLEAKTGYHLDEEGELDAVRLLSAAGKGPDGPALEVTFLPGHAVPPEWRDDQDGYVREAARWSGAARRAGARHVDVFCDEGYFTPEQSRLLLQSGQAAGLVPRLHADELALSGGAALAAELGCASADHLLRVDASGMAALAKAGVVATLAPVTALAMGKAPPARALLETGVTLALGTDHNPGTCGSTSMSLVLALAVAELGLSVKEALTAATAGGARSLRLQDRGLLRPGLRADLVAWEAEHEGAFAWSYGLAPRAVWRAGAFVSPPG